MQTGIVGKPIRDRFTTALFAFSLRAQGRIARARPPARRVKVTFEAKTKLVDSDLFLALYFYFGNRFYFIFGMFLENLTAKL